MSTSGDDIKARVDAAMLAVRPNIPRPLNSNPNLNLDHQIIKVFPDIATSFGAFRTYADNVYAIEYQREQIGPCRHTDAPRRGRYRRPSRVG
jgi:hypothetical protein